MHLKECAMKLKEGIDSFPSKLGENRLIQRTTVSVLALICGGFAMALGTPPTEHEVISASIQLEISEASKDLSDHLSLFKLPSEIFEEITGVGVLCPIPGSTIFDALAFGVGASIYGEMDCVAGCKNEYNDRIIIVNLEYIECIADHPDPKDTGKQQIGTSPE